MAVLLFDFFGTLVEYDASRTAQGYQRTHAELTAIGVDLEYADFLMRWDDTAARFDAASEVDDHEFSMIELGTAFLRAALGRTPSSSRAGRSRSSRSRTSAGAPCPSNT